MASAAPATCWLQDPTVCAACLTASKSSFPSLKRPDERERPLRFLITSPPTTPATPPAPTIRGVLTRSTASVTARPAALVPAAAAFRAASASLTADAADTADFPFALLVAWAILASFHARLDFGAVQSVRTPARERVNDSREPCRSVMQPVMELLE